MFCSGFIHHKHEKNHIYIHSYIVNQSFARQYPSLEVVIRAVMSYFTHFFLYFRMNAVNRYYNENTTALLKRK